MQTPSLIKLGSTHISRCYPFGTNSRSGHRLLCSDGKIRAAELSECSDSFFSTPARCRIGGKWVSGYATVDASSVAPYLSERSAFTFRIHNEENKKLATPLPEWPDSSTKEKFDLLECGEEKQIV